MPLVPAFGAPHGERDRMVSRAAQQTPWRSRIAPTAYLCNGQGVDMLCWTDNQWVYPPNSDYAANRWFTVSSPVGTGFVHFSLVEGQRPVDRCP